MSNETILTGHIPGAMGRLVELHAEYYHQNWGFGLFFEAKVAAEMAEFFRRFDEARDGFWTASTTGWKAVLRSTESKERRKEPISVGTSSPQRPGAEAWAID